MLNKRWYMLSSTDRFSTPNRNVLNSSNDSSLPDERVNHHHTAHQRKTRTPNPLAPLRCSCCASESCTVPRCDSLALATLSRATHKSSSSLPTLPSLSQRTLGHLLQAVNVVSSQPRRPVAHSRRARPGTATFSPFPATLRCNRFCTNTL
jgi:hypothetical protein